MSLKATTCQIPSFSITQLWLWFSSLPTQKLKLGSEFIFRYKPLGISLYFLFDYISKCYFRFNVFVKYIILTRLKLNYCFTKTKLPAVLVKGKIYGTFNKKLWILTILYDSFWFSLFLFPSSSLHFFLSIILSIFCSLQLHYTVSKKLTFLELFSPVPDFIHFVIPLYCRMLSTTTALDGWRCLVEGFYIYIDADVEATLTTFPKGTNLRRGCELNTRLSGSGSEVVKCIHGMWFPSPPYCFESWYCDNTHNIVPICGTVQSVFL